MKTGGFFGRLRSLTYEDLLGLQQDQVTEGPILEFKGDIKGAEDLADDLCAMANSLGGRIILGAARDANDRTIASFKPTADADLRKRTSLVANAATLVEPAVHHEIQPVAAPGGGWILVIEVMADAAGPRQRDGRYVQRVGSRTIGMSHTAVVSAILSSQRHHGQEDGYREFEMPENPGPQQVFLGIRLDPPSLLPTGFCDPASREHVDAMLAAFAAESLSGAHAGRRDVALVTPTRRVAFTYRGGTQEVAATVVFNSGGQINLVRIGSLESRIRETIARLARILSACGYAGKVDVTAQFMSVQGQSVILRPEGDSPMDIVIKLGCAAEHLGTEVLEVLTDDQSPDVGRFVGRFIELLRRSAVR